MRILYNNTCQSESALKRILYSNDKMFKFLFIICFIFQYHSDFLFAQQFLNSKEVKIRSPLKEIWEFKTNTATLNFKINDSICYVNTIDGIHAVSLNDGKEIWKHSFPADSSISSVVTFSDKFAVYVNYKDQHSNLILIDLSNGKEKWHLKSESTNIYKPTTLLNDEFVFCVDGTLVDWDDRAKFNEMAFMSSKVKAFKINDGKVIWEMDMQDSQTDLMSVAGNYLFISFDLTDKSNKIMCVDVKSGNKKWDFKPGGFWASFKAGGIQFFNNALYIYPQYGGKGQFARVDVSSGEERWYIKLIERQRNFIIANNKIYNISENWQSFNPNNGDELISKSLLSSNFLSELFSEMGKSIFLARTISVLANWSYYFPESDKSKLKFMPSIHMLKGLQIEDVVNDKGFFSIVRDGDEVYYKSANFKKDDDEENELHFTQDEKDLCLSNGTSDSLIFASSKGVVYCINFVKNSIQWKKDFSKEEKELSIGLLYSGEKLLLITNKRIIGLISE